MSRSYVYSVWHLTKSRYHLSKQEYREVCMEDIMLKTYSNHFGGFLLYLTCVHQNRVCSNKQHILELLIFATCFVSVLLILYIYYVIVIRKQLLNNFFSLLRLQKLILIISMFIMMYIFILISFFGTQQRHFHRLQQLRIFVCLRSIKLTTIKPFGRK